MPTSIQNSPMVGRAAELQQLRGALEDAQNRRGSIWLVAGEAGIGKSRVVNEVIRAAQENGVRVYSGHDIEEGGLPYQCWGHIISALALESGLDDFEASILKEIVPQLNALLEQDIPEISRLEPRTHQQRINVVISDIVRRSTAPTLLILEDIHWSHVSLEPLKLLGRFVEMLPFLIVASYRQDIQPELPDMLITPGTEGNIKRMVLEPLTQEDVKEACQMAYPESDQVERIAKMLIEASTGNTMLIIEGLEYLKTTYPDPTQIGDQVLPDGIETIVDFRLGLMPENTHTLLYAAAVGGPLLDLVAMVDLFAQYGDERSTLSEWLELAAGAGWLKPTPNNQWRFRSDRLRRALLGRVEESRLKLLHTRAAEALQRHLFNELDMYSPRLTYHYSHTDDWEREQYFAYLAGRSAASYGADDLAQSYLNKSLWLSNDDETIKLLEIHLQLEAIYHRQGRRDLQAKALQELESLVTQSQSNSYAVRVGLRRAHFAHRLGQDGIALETVQQTSELARAYEMLAEEAEAHFCWGQIYLRLKDFDTARSHFENALNLAQEAHEDDIEMLTLRALGSIALDEAEFDEATDYYARTLHLSHEIGDRMGKGMALNNLGEVARYQRDFQMARTYYDQSLKIFHEVGYVRGETFLLYNLGLAARDLGDFTASLNYYDDGLALARRIRDRYNEGWALLGMGEVYNRLGNYSLAQSQLERALLVFHEIQQKDAESWVYAAMSTLALQTGDMEAAVNHAEQALQLAREDGDSMLQARALMRMGHALVGLNRADEAVGSFELSAGIYTYLGEHHLAAESTAGVAKALMMVQDFKEARQRIETVLSYLAADTLDGVDDPLQTYLICYRVLELKRDDRSSEILARAIDLMEAQERMIADTELRQSFRTTVPSNRALMQSWQDLNAHIV